MSEESSSQSSSQTSGMMYQQTFPAHLQVSSEATSGGVNSSPIGALEGFSRMEDAINQQQPAAIPSSVPPIAAIMESSDVININNVNCLSANAVNANNGDNLSGSQISHRGAEETEEARMDRLFNQQNLLMALEDEEVDAQMKEDEEHGMDEEHLNTMTTMEKENLSSNKRQMTSWLRKWLYALKSYFLFVHIGYICAVALISSILIYLMEINNTDIDYIDALFAACSFVSCTGLVAVDLEKWSPESYAVRMMTMILGGNCFMSATMPLLRWFTLRRLKEETIVDDDDRYVLKRWKLRKRNFIDRLETTAILCATGTYFYWCAVHIICFIILVSIPNDNMRVGEVLEHVITAFQNCCSLSLEDLADNGVFIFVIAVCVAGGNTLFPLFFRIQFHGLLFVMRSYKSVANWWERRHDIKGDDDEEENLIGGEGTEYGGGRPSNLGSMLRGRQSNIVPNLSRDATWDEGRAQGISKWELGVLTILQHEDPGVFHPFLFSWSQTRYIIYTFILLNSVQMLPFLIQQWDVTLAPFGDAQKFLVAFCQSVYVRFAGVNIVDNMKFSNVHTMWMLFAMYIPVIPIPGDRGKRKWKELARAGAWRLLSSRIFLLFFSMSVIVWIEEERLRKQMEGTRFDITTRALFELVSGYSTSGMSLPLSGNNYFTESLTNMSRMIIALNMIIGRHRWMDLGIDIGLDQLEESDRVIQKYLREREEEWTEAGGGDGDEEQYGEEPPTKSRSILDRIRGGKRANSDIWDGVEQSTMHFRPPPGGGGSGSRAPSVLSRGSNLRQVRRSILERHMPNATATIPAPGRRFPAIAVGDQLAAPPSSGSRRTPASTPRLHPSSARSRPNSYGPASAGSLPISRSSPRSNGTPRSALANSSISTSVLPNRRGSRHASIAPQSSSNTPRSPAAVVKTLAAKVGPAASALATKVQPPKRGGAATRSVAVSSVLDSRSSMNSVRKSSSNDE